MNSKQRKELDRISALVDEARAVVEEMAGDERGKFDNLTEGLQASERGQSYETAAEHLEEALSNLEEALSAIEEATSA